MEPIGGEGGLGVEGRSTRGRDRSGLAGRGVDQTDAPRHTAAAVDRGRICVGCQPPAVGRPRERVSGDELVAELAVGPAEGRDRSGSCPWLSPAARTNAICRPSGDQLGKPSARGVGCQTASLAWTRSSSRRRRCCHAFSPSHCEGDLFAVRRERGSSLGTGRRGQGDGRRRARHRSDATRMKSTSGQSSPTNPRGPPQSGAAVCRRGGAARRAAAPKPTSSVIS